MTMTEAQNISKTSWNKKVHTKSVKSKGAKNAKKSIDIREPSQADKQKNR